MQGTHMTNQTSDHKALTDTYASRRYFRMFEAITGHLVRIVATMEIGRAHV